MILSSIVFCAPSFTSGTLRSIKVRDSADDKRSIAHFYRNCEIWPRLDPASVLSVAPRPLQASTAKSFSLLTGHEQKAKLTAQLHRLHWVAGQRCHVKVLVDNRTRKSVKSCTLTLVRTTTVFRPKPALDAGGGNFLTSDPDACQTSTTHKAVAISVLEMGQSGAKGYASAKGWWTGIRPGQELEFSHFIQLPVSRRVYISWNVLRLGSDGCTLNYARPSIGSGIFHPHHDQCGATHVRNFRYAPYPHCQLPFHRSPTKCSLALQQWRIFPHCPAPGIFYIYLVRKRLGNGQLGCDEWRDALSRRTSATDKSVRSKHIFR